MNNAEFFDRLKKLVDKGLAECGLPCETMLLKTSKEISDLIFSRPKIDWAGNEMLGKLIILLVKDTLNENERIET